MSFKNRFCQFLILTLFILIGCGEDEVSHADQVVGYWKVREENSVLLNGIQHTEYTNKYWIEFYDNQCGQIFDLNENPTSEIKWAYVEREDYDRMIISYRLGGGNSLDLYTNEVNEVLKFNEDDFRLWKRAESEVGDSIYSTDTHAFFQRQ